MSDSAISLNRALRTPKISPDAGNFAQGLRLFDSMSCVAPLNVDQFGRSDVSVNSGFPQLNKSGGLFGTCFSPEYLIENENAVTRPQYNEYLNVPQGLMMYPTEYPNRPKADLMGVGRDRVFDLDGWYVRPAYDPKAMNPESQQDYNIQTDWYNQQLITKFDNRRWINSAEAGF